MGIFNELIKMKGRKALCFSRYSSINQYADEYDH